MPNSTPVPRSVRAVNVLALLIFLAGAALYARAWVGMRSLYDYEPPPDAPPFSAMALFNDYWQMSRLALLIISGAVAVALLAAGALVLLRRREARRIEAAGEPPAGPAD